MPAARSVPAQATFREARPDDLPHVERLLSVAFDGRWPGFPIRVTPLEHLQWKLGAPRHIPAGVSVMEVDGRIAGFEGMVGRDVWLRGRRRPGWMSVDSSVHPEFQGQGLSRAHLRWYLDRWANAEQPIALDAGSTHPRFFRSSGPGADRPRVANKIEVLTRPTNGAALRRRLLRDRSWRSVLRVARLEARALRARIRTRRAGPQSRPLTVRSVDHFDDRADALWERARTQFDYAVVRDREYLDWRYCDPRGGPVSVRVAEEGDALVGYAVTAFIDGELQIVDILTAPGDDDALRALLDDSIESSRVGRALLVSVLLPRVHPYRQGLRRAGFFAAGQAANWGFRERNDTALDFLVEDPRARLHVSFGDADHV